MRVIKFRAKIKAKDFREKLAMAGKPKNEGEWIVGDIHLQSIIPHIHYMGDKYPIDVDTIGQFTGLKDVNSKEIYEGDIIKGLDSTQNDILHIIKWDSQTASFEAHLMPIGPYLHKSPLSQNWLDFFDKEVIGNIHDNPDLLEGGAE